MDGFDIFATLALIVTVGFLVWLAYLVKGLRAKLAQQEMESEIRLAQYHQQLLAEQEAERGKTRQRPDEGETPPV